MASTSFFGKGFRVSSKSAATHEPFPLGYRPLIGFVAALSATVPHVAAAALCQAGSYSSDGTDATGCTQAHLGHFVPIAGARSETPASPGQFVSVTGATSASLAPVGSYVPAAGASAATLAHPGFLVSTLGASAQTPAPVGFYVPGSGASVALPAQAGSFVGTTGASAATPAPPGTFVQNVGASAPTPAARGFYVPSSGSTNQIPADIGHYVPVAGSSVQTLASPGHYVNVTGSSTQTPSPAGYYIPVAGAVSAAQAVAAAPGFFAAAGSGSQSAAPAGFYTYATGASRPVPAGLIAAPMDAVMLTMDTSWTNLSGVLGRKNDAPIKASVYYQAGKVSQDGQSSGSDSDHRASALNFAADVFERGDAGAGISLNVSHASFSAPTDGSGKTNGFLFGVYKRFAFERGDASIQLAGGTFDFDTDRQNFSQGSISGVAANSQSATGSGHVSAAAINGAAARQLSDRMANVDLVGRASIARYQFGGFVESGAGAQGDPNAALSVGARSLVAVPLTLGLRYRFPAADPAHGPSIMIGYRYDLAGTKSIDIVPQGAASVRATVPIALSGSNGFVLELSAPECALTKSVSLDAGLLGATGSRYSYLQGTVTLRAAF